MNKIHIHLLKFAGVALVFLLAVLFTDPSYSSNLPRPGHLADVATGQPGEPTNEGEDQSLYPPPSSSTPQYTQPTRTIAGSEVPDFDFVPYLPNYLPEGLEPQDMGVIDTLGNDNFYIYYQLDGKPVMEIYQAVGLGYDWDVEPEFIDLAWGQVEIGQREINEISGLIDWIALVKPYAQEQIQVPNIVVVLQMPYKNTLLKVVKSLQPFGK